MLLLFTSYVAGVLTVLAPCVLPLLPIIVGDSVEKDGKKPILILIGSLSLSIVVFTLLLRASTIFISIPQSTWTTISGSILVAFGLITLFPHLWESISQRANNSSTEFLQSASAKQGWKREALIGVALGPVFTSCSPTYALILATVLPSNFFIGVFYTIVYAAGLATILYLISLLGQKLTVKLRSAADPNGWFKRSLGAVFLIVGLAIIFGWDKDVEAFIIDQGYFGITSFEEKLVEEIK